ncbi:MAG: exopolyphosphatase, partial [Lachnospiraceae bacterium]|nr:exopolyphosphatase [Lachnospiraceae bacterium]
DHWMFAHPKDLQDGLVEINENDCLANVPYVEGCGLWFDHHSSEFERNELAGKYKGESRITPSCARIIYEYYGGKDTFPNFDDMMEAVDKVDSGNLTIDEIMNPEGWILVGFLMDPRTGLGRWRQFTVSNYQLMEKLMIACKDKSTAEILAMPDVKERIEVYEEQTAKFKEMVTAHTRTEGNVIISDLRGVDPIYTGNRFMIYSMYPEQNISAWIVNGRGGHGCSAAVGYSILNRTCKVNVGHLMLKYNGGGHEKVGTCQFTDDNMETDLPKMLKELCDLANG